ncbi:hypothetical protein Bca4012_094789 [Brassica carinata]
MVCESNRHEESLVEFHWRHFIAEPSRRIHGQVSLVSFHVMFFCSETYGIH